MDALKELIKISTTVGGNKSLVLGNFGNTSVKTEDGQWMYIKVSGVPLSSLDTESGWRRVRLADITALMRDRNLVRMDAAARTARLQAALLLACDDDRPPAVKPSIETFFHALLDDVVIHLHPEAVLAAACAKNGRRYIERVFANDKHPPLWVPYAGLGYPSARTIQTHSNRYEKEYGRKPQALILQNHGLVVSAGSSGAALRRVKQTVAALADAQTPAKSGSAKRLDADAVKSAQLAIRQAVFNAGGPYTTVRLWTDARIQATLNRPTAKSLCTTGPLTPDEAAMTCGGPLWIESVNAAKLTTQLERIKQAGKPLPVSFAVKGIGLFTAAPAACTESLGEFACSYLRVRKNAARRGGLRPIPPRAAAAYAECQPAGLPGGVLSGRVSLVTGAGSGLGRSIAVGLARAGANVALLDIDTTAGSETAQLIADECPQAATLAIPCNVISEQSVREAFDAVMEKWGGVDILVNAAGVAPAFALVDLPVDKWRFALEVNLTGYFLTAQAAARIMIEQDIGGAIINISSKSGLEPSKNNTPYNATKAGEIHMARGWALELGPHNIRVNSVCPGNVFEGSKIWNADYIKVCAKKYGIKPDQVIPYYISKTALNREIKGQDIADSVVFLASDQARRITGQTLATDAGQVYVR